MRDLLKFYRLLGDTFYVCINTIHQYITPFLNNKMSIFEDMEPLSKMAAMPIYEKKKKKKHLKNLFQNQERFEAENWYIAFGT